MGRSGAPAGSRATRARSAQFRAIYYTFALGKYAADRSSYHVLARADRAPAAMGLADAGLPRVLENFDARQVLHLTYGSVLTARDDRGRPVAEVDPRSIDIEAWKGHEEDGTLFVPRAGEMLYRVR